MKLKSGITLAGKATFQKLGTIAFGTGSHRLRFSKVGCGHFGTAPNADCGHGVANWRLDYGDSQFVGVSGMIVSRFIASEVGQVTGDPPIGNLPR